MSDATYAEQVSPPIPLFRQTLHDLSATQIAFHEFMKCLIVDDHAVMRQLIGRILRGAAGTVIECSDGEDAVIRYAEELPDWVFMDINMKSIDGISAARCIRSEYPEARIVIVTHHDDEALRHAAAEAGVHAYVLKENLLRVRELVLATVDQAP